LLGGEKLLVALIALYIAILAVWPLVRLFVEALQAGPGGEHLGVLLDQWRSPAAKRALINTVETSVLATLVSVAIGAAIAFLLTLTDLRGKAALTFVALLPLLVPSQITALAWIEFTGASSPILAPLGLAPTPGTTNPLYSKWGIVLVLGIENSTLVFLAVRAGLRLRTGGLP
jgi:iron(III) transport system permease protein